MRVIHSVRNLQSWRRTQESLDGPIGFVPTMGALHDGHLSLLHRARKRCRIVVVSVFVNPLQFGPAEDFGRYPRSFDADRRLCQEAGVDLLFAPRPEEFYPSNFQTTVMVNRLTQRWEGQARPAHFHGVTTVVAKLFCLVRPHLAYFGQKDYQQSLVVGQLIQDLNLDMRIIRCPTVREPDGLAVSSRNRYLGNDERQQATLLYRALSAGKRCVQDGERNVGKVHKRMANILATQSGVSVEYLAVCDGKTLEPLKGIRGTVALLGALRIGSVRLIDNLLTRSPR